MKTSIRQAVRKLVASLLIAGIASGAGAQTVVSGQATFQQQGNVRAITNTPGTIIQWPGFSIAAGDVTRFIQQSSTSAVLNRITGQEPSRILGALESNGRVVLVNPNGVLFGAGSRVDVNGLVASSLNISNSDFLAGKMNFAAGTVAGKVTNQGRIATPDGGQVVLIAPDVENNGVIQSPGGNVVLAAGHSVKLADTNNPALHVIVSAPADQAVNLGQIVAQGGRIDIYGGLVNQRGLVNADSATVGANGQIVFKASGDLLLENGSTTSAKGAGTGGIVHLLGDRVGLMGDAKVDASGQTGGGTVLAGGDYQGKNPAIANAQQVFVSKDASIAADALQSGNGGKVIAWSDGTTRMLGSISARGGAQSGNGGFVEVSGRTLDMRGVADTRAPKGRMGTLLLDPTNIWIADDQASATGAGMAGTDTSAEGFSASGAVSDSLLTVATLQTQLGVSMVTVSTANAAGGGAGMITVVNPVTWASDTGLTLNADAGININAAITGGNGSQLTLRTTGGNITQSGRVAVTTLSAQADTGSVNLGTANEVRFISGSGATGFVYNGGDMAAIIQGAGITTQGTGAINIHIAGNLTVNGPVSAAAGNVTVLSDGVFTNNATIASTSGNVNVQSVVVQASLAECTANPALANCAAVLPTLAACTAAPATAGCSAVLPSLAACTATPSLPGCSAVLPPVVVAPPAPTPPTLAVCVAAPSTDGCGAILPTLSACVTSPTTAGCSAVLPALASCVANPAATGCSAVLPGLALCTTNPTTPGCSVVLPSLAVCSANPSVAGCSVVLPTVSSCIATPSRAGCAAVLPSLAACTANPTAAGCSVVLPSLSSCAAVPSLAGCSVVLPSLAQCIASPTQTGCSAVLPTLASCVSNPATAGCGSVLPTLSRCIVSPALAGCSVVLPTLAQCVGAPTLQGCSAVLPPVSACVANPTAPGCVVVVPTTQTPSNQPVNQAINTVVNTINTASASTAGSPPSASGDSKTADAKTGDKKDDSGTGKDLLAKTDDVRKKTYCN